MSTPFAELRNAIREYLTDSRLEHLDTLSGELALAVVESVSGALTPQSPGLSSNPVWKAAHHYGVQARLDCDEAVRDALEEVRQKVTS